MIEIYKNNNVANLTINQYNTEKCSEEGTFTLYGLVNNNEVSKDGENIINFINPDSAALCHYYKTAENNKMELECQNQDEFSDSSIIVGNQFMNENIFLNKFYLEGPISCKVGSLSYKVDDIIIDNYGNKYFSKTGSSGGLSGGAIAAIVIICCLVVISIGVLIALMKNGVIATSKSKQDSSIPPITNSSAYII